MNGEDRSKLGCSVCPREDPCHTISLKGISILTDPINHPKHYTSHPSGVECIQVTEHMNFNLGNVVKYLWRSDNKHQTPVEDLKKARWYLDREIERIQKTNTSKHNS